MNPFWVTHSTSGNRRSRGTILFFACFFSRFIAADVLFSSSSADGILFAFVFVFVFNSALIFLGIRAVSYYLLAQLAVLRELSFTNN